MCTCANLRSATRAVTQLYDAALRPSGLTASQFAILATLSALGAVAQSVLAHALVMDRTTLIRNLRPLVDRGLIDAAPTGRRGQKTLSLTTAGEGAYRNALPHWRTAQQRLADGLGHGHWGELIQGLRAAVAAAQAS